MFSMKCKMEKKKMIISYLLEHNDLDTNQKLRAICLILSTQ